MKYGLEIADAWLHAHSSAWKRAGLFWIFVTFVGWASSALFGLYNGIGDDLQLGGFTYVILGPVSLWSVLTAAVTWIRVTHRESAGIRSFLLLGVLISINGWLMDRDMTALQIILAHLTVVILIGLAFFWWRSGGECLWNRPRDS
ncbi:MAG: hypothetical protein J0M04_15575 [Verrucomicrobia bacterium]|nr:hypothetical protein [Verrucomicrobiota bacterium]